jgi:hypothetical protein
VSGHQEMIGNDSSTPPLPRRARAADGPIPLPRGPAHRAGRALLRSPRSQLMTLAVCLDTTSLSDGCWRRWSGANH